MNSSNHLIYPDYLSTANIHDARHTGAGKTTHVCDKMNELIPLGESFIYISSSYDTLDGVKSRLNNSQSLTFKGKTQEGMCPYWRDYLSISEHIRPLYTCFKCNFQDNCPYRKQFDRLDELKNSGSGFVIFTVKENLVTVLKRVPKTDPYIIIDDASLSDITYPSLTISEESLIEASKYLKQWVIYSKLDKPISLLLEGKFEEAKRFVRGNEEYKNELNTLKESVSLDLSDGKKIPNLKVFDSLLECNNIYEYERNNSRSFVIASSNLSKLRKYRIIYLNATADSNDRHTMSKLGNFETITKDIEVTQNYYLLQIMDGRYPKSGLESPHSRLPKEINRLLDRIRFASNYTGKPLVIMAHNSIHAAWCKREDMCLDQVEYEFVKYFGSDSKATNKYRSFQISIIIGTPILPGGYYIHPSRDCSIINDGGYPESVSQEEIDSDSRGLIHQMIGRTFREDKNNPDCLKLIILFSNIELGNIGATVEKYRLRDTKQNKTFYSRVKELASQIYEEPIIAKACEGLDQGLSQSPIPMVSLNRFSENVNSACRGLLSTNRISECLKKHYAIEERINPGNHRPAQYIIGKIGVKSEAVASIKDVCSTIS